MRSECACRLLYAAVDVRYHAATMSPRSLLLLAVAASLGYFAIVVARRLRGLAWARANLSFHQPVRRLGRLFGEVLLQRRVLAERPVAGLLHALVMWGFLAFAWVSIEHLWQGVVGLESSRRDDSLYGWFAAVWAVAVIVGITGLAFRRFVVRPSALGAHLSAGSAAVALLILVLMGTYLAGWRGLEPGSERWQWNWAAHTAALLAMLWVIPNSKHLHLVLGPVAVFFRGGETTSGTRPLDEADDDDFGMMHFSDLSQKDVLDVNACVECGRCSEVCPANLTGGSLDPKRIILQMQGGLLAAGNPAEAVISGTEQNVAEGAAWVAEQDLFQCFACGACEQACPVGIEHVGAKILDLRRGLVSEGRTHNEKLTELFTTMERAPHNAWGAPQKTRRKLVQGDEFPVFDGTQEWLLWLGCGLSYDPHGNEVARAMKRILDAASVDWGVLEKETCCGEPARRAGNEFLYMELSEKVISAFSESEVRKIVVCDPHCTSMFDGDYRDNPLFEEQGIEVLHHTELLTELLPSLPLGAREEAVSYHDPCRLARGRGTVDAPREVLQNLGIDLLEPERHGKQGLCCGAGGAQLFIADDAAESGDQKVNDVRFEQIAATGTKTIAAACPYCPIMLNDAAGRAGRSDVRIVDVAELVAERLPTRDSESLS